LIEVTRMEGDPTAVKFEPLSAGAIVDEVVKGCTVEADARQCRIVVRNEITRGLTGHPELLRRAVENVLRNAIRYAPPSTDISVEAVDSQPGIRRLGLGGERGHQARKAKQQHALLHPFLLPVRAVNR
jgi:signal transduction histidine kinase